MRARSSLIFLLLLSLLFATQVHPLARPVEMTKGSCAGMPCVQTCCANVACCAVSQRQQAPQPPAPAGTDFQLATIGLRVFALLYTLPQPARAFVIHDEARAGHLRPTRAVTCIRLI